MTSLKNKNFDAEQLFLDEYKTAENTLYRLLQRPHSVARNNSVEFEDLLQYARLGLWNAATSYNGSTKFKTHAINHIRWAVLNALNDECDQFSHDKNTMTRDEHFNVTSFEQKVSVDSEPDSLTLHDVIASEDSEIGYEDTIVRDTLSKYISNLSDRHKDILIMREKGYTYQDIADKYGLYKQSVQRTHINLCKQLQEKAVKK